MWPPIYVCLDLAYSIGILNQFYNNFGSLYIKLIKHILQSISEILDLSLKFDKEIDILYNVIRYIDSNFIRSKIDQKLMINYVFMLARAAISHSSKF